MDSWFKLRMNKGEVELIRRIARKERRTMSKIVRTALSNYIGVKHGEYKQEFENGVSLDRWKR